MTQTVLIAEARDILRTGLRIICSHSKYIDRIYEASSKEELLEQLRTQSIQFVIVNQSLQPDMSILPRNFFVILTPELNITEFQTARKYGARGYLLENTSTELIHAVLTLPPGSFLIEPTGAMSIINYFSQDRRFMVKEELLTPRERQIIQLLQQGIDRSVISTQLNISKTTLKTHIKNISKKREN